MADPLNANLIIEKAIRQQAEKVEDLLTANVLTYIGPVDDGAHAFLKFAVESISIRRRRLVVCLETHGGFIESAERIANTLRHHYRYVDFVVTTFAMSAGTVLVMCGDNIYMDYSATLGPIDPQLPRSNKMVPALGYLEQYERLIEKSRDGSMTPAELAYLLQHFDPAELYQYEQARDLSIALLEEWLVRYKFRNWKVTEKRGIPVTMAMKRERAADIAKLLCDTKRWHSHSRGISMQVARQDLNLQIADLDDNIEVRDAIRSYHTLLLDYRMKQGHHRMTLDWVGGYHGH